MKIRIKDSAVRFRLTQSEVAKLGEEGLISSFTEFVDRPFIYAIERTEEAELSAAFIENRMVLKMPAAMINEWITTDRVGFEGQTGKIKLLIEKDFVCIDNTLEDQSDNYPNPNLKC